MVSNVTTDLLTQLYTAPSGTKTAAESSDSFQKALKDAVKDSKEPSPDKTEKPDQSQKPDEATGKEPGEDPEQLPAAQENLLFYLAGMMADPQSAAIQQQMPGEETGMTGIAQTEAQGVQQVMPQTEEPVGNGTEVQASMTAQETAASTEASPVRTDRAETELPQDLQPVENQDDNAVQPLKTAEDKAAGQNSGEQSEGLSDKKPVFSAQGKKSDDTEVKSDRAAENANLVSKPESRMEAVEVRPAVNTQEASPADIKTAQLAEEQILPQIRAGKQDFTIQLEPESLGKLVIKATTENGQTSISIFCTNEKTLHLLSTRAGELGSIMENNLGTPTQVFVDKGEENYLNQGQADQDNRGGQQEPRQEKKKDDGSREKLDFLQQLRLGLA